MTNRTYKNGVCREQASLLPPRMDDYVGLDNPVRAIDAYVRSLDMAGLGFKHGKGGGGAGQPPYDPADLLKLYLYGYLNQVRSSRRLERETGRNVEVMWLLGGLSRAWRLFSTVHPDNAHFVRESVPAKISSLYLARHRGIDAGKIVKWSSAKPDWADQLKASLQDPAIFKNTVDAMADAIEAIG